ncbi:LysR family transcriptional regulator [Vibrio viridaestus]|uniref:LysR family transcriptional regulator n=1 Tax=Vibrio viridaestus TaxID=2487322 RepID=A0A3N9TEL2_9VIBR|nr:LysR family transcriptional regulator [Vibrio viridaestus]RQW62677.1 LysR family transcriptional regulator [Vibrio viridaestus]
MLQTKLISLLPDLATFILIVQEGSFTAAAKKLDITPSALSKLITRLEKSLGVKLFERTTRSLVITQAGQRVYEQSVIMVNAAQQAIEMSTADHLEPVGSITVSAPEAFLFSVLQPFVIPFLKQYPDIQLKLRAVDGNIDLIKENIDIAFLLTDKPDEKLVLKEICTTHLVLCASPNYLEQRGIPDHPNDLQQHDCLYLAETSRDNTWTFQQGDALFSVEVSGRYALNHSQMRLNGVKSGLGIGIFHDFVVKDALEKGEVVRVLEPWTIRSNYHGAIVMQYAQTQFMPNRIRVFLDFMSDKLKERFS